MVAAVFCLSAGGAGQVYQIQGGNVLDANPQVGAGGYNRPVPSGPDFSSQLYVTGQVSGLGAFHGRMAYFAADQLHLNLPSAQLSDFDRRAVGLPQVLAGQPYLPSAYRERTTTLLRMDDILAGRTLPGTGAAVPPTAASVTSELGRRLYVDALSDYSPLSSPVTGAALAPQFGAGSVSQRTGHATPGGRILLPTAITPAAPALGASTGMSTERDLFGLPRSEDQTALARELYAQARQYGLRDTRVDARVDANAPTGAGEPVAIKPAATSVVPTPTDMEPTSGQDAFLDVLWQLNRRRKLLEATSQPAGTTPLDANAFSAAPSVTRLPGSSLVEAGPDNRIVIHALAGQSKDLFNLRMGKARERLQSGRYYDAADLYETASLVDTRNPLARIGMGLSLLGAGESLSAAHQLERALAVFPPIAQTRLDLDRVMGEKAVESQLRLLEERIARADPDTRKMLQFLATFLYYNAGQDDKAKTYAEKLRDVAAPDSIVRSYAEAVLRAKGEPETAPPKPPAKPETPPEP